MKLFFLWTVLFLSTTLSLVLNKICSGILFGKGYIGQAAFVFLNGVFSCFVYLAYNGFVIKLNLSSVLLAVLYAFFCIFSVTLGIIVYQYADVASINIVKSSLTLITTFLVGLIFFKEKLTVIKAIRVILMIFAALFIFIDSKKESANVNPKNINHNFFKFILITVALIPVGCYSTVQAKLATFKNLIPNVNSYFFMTNLVMVVFSSIWILFCFLKNSASVINCINNFKLRGILTMITLAVNSSVSAIIGVVILKYIDISVYSPIYSAITILCSAFVSFLLKEFPGKLALFAVVLAFFAVII